MSQKQRIDTDNPVFLSVEFVSTATEVVSFTKLEADFFNPNVKFRIVQNENDRKPIKTLSVGEGITIDNNTMSLVFNGADFSKYINKKVLAIGDPVNAGYRDMIIDITVKYNG